MIVVKEVSDKLEYEIILNMLYEYIIELSNMYSRVFVRKPNELAEEYFQVPDTKIFICYNDIIPIGFCVVGYNDNCHELVDIYINEFYIKPLYRKQGFGRLFINDIINTMQANSICMFTLKENINAERFWKSFFYNWLDASKTYHYSSVVPEQLNWHVYIKVKKDFYNGH